MPRAPFLPYDCIYLCTHNKAEDSLRKAADSEEEEQKGEKTKAATAKLKGKAPSAKQAKTVPTISTGRQRTISRLFLQEVSRLFLQEDRGLFLQEANELFLQEV